MPDASVRATGTIGRCHAPLMCPSTCLHSPGLQSSAPLDEGGAIVLLAAGAALAAGEGRRALRLRLLAAAAAQVVVLLHLARVARACIQMPLMLLHGFKRIQ